MSLREQFEEWIKSTAIQDTEGLFDRSQRDSEKYANPMLEGEWQAFQAGFDLSVCQLETMLDAAATVMGEDGEDEDE